MTPQLPSLDELREVGLSLDRHEGVLTITLDRPEQRNAQRPAMWRRLAQIGEWVGHARPHAVIVQAEGTSFSAGLDRAMFTAEGIPGEPSLLALGRSTGEELESFIQGAQSGFRWFGEVESISIAAVRGHAVGAGFQLALACDICIPHPDAVFAVRETPLGLVPDLGGTLPLVAGAGLGQALEACLTGRFVTATELHGWGLALSPVEEPEAHARSLAAAIASLPTGSASALKGLLVGVDQDLRAAQWERERRVQIERIRSLASLIP